MVDHARASKYRLLEIARAARLLNEAGQQRLKKSYGRLLRLTRGVLPRPAQFWPGSRVESSVRGPMRGCGCCASKALCVIICRWLSG